MDTFRTTSPRPRGSERDAIAQQFGANLRRERRYAGFSQEGLALIGGLHRTEISKLERGESAPRIDTLMRLAGALEITANDLLSGISWQSAHHRSVVRAAAGTFYIHEQPVGSTP